MNDLAHAQSIQTNTQYHSACLGVVLTGGLSSRMGQDKATLAYKNSNMLAFSRLFLKRIISMQFFSTKG